MRRPASRALAEYLKEIEKGQESSVHLDQNPRRRYELESLSEMAGLLRAAPGVELRPAFRQTARRRLLRQLPDRQPVTF